MQAESIVVIVAVSLLILYVIASVIRARTRGIFPSWIPFILMFVGVLFLILVIFGGQEIQPYHWAEVLVLIGLLLVTAVYADSTAKMAKEMREERYSENLPVLVPKLIPKLPTQSYNLEHNEVDYLELTTGLKVKWHNVGTGVAINSRFSLWSVPFDNLPDKAQYFPPYEFKALRSGEHEEIDFSSLAIHEVININESYQPRLEAEYQDIHERKITTIQKFHIEEQNNSKKAFWGDLYFTINGRRLGQEVGKDD